MFFLEENDFPVLDKETYRKKLSNLQMRLMHYQQGLYQQGKRAILVVEGTDAAGKGGVIRRLVHYMDPRGYRVYPIGSPTDDELKRHYLHRFWEKIPHAGQLAILDRSWYGRVLVERVECGLKEAIWHRAYDELNQFEKLLTDDNVIIIKLFLYISKEEQRQRFLSRLQQTEKRWKLTMADLTSREFWNEYHAAYEDMIQKTSTAWAPWTLIPANCKKYSRIQTMETVLNAFESHIEISKVKLMPKDIEKKALEILG